MLCLILILAPSAPLPDGFVDREVLPILKQHCGKCHLDGKSKGGLSLSNQQSLDEGGDSGPAVDAKTPRNGLLAKVLRYDGEMKMPPTGKLPPQQLEKLMQWIDAGAPLPNATKTAPTTQKPGTPDDKSYWAYQKVKPVSVPPVVGKAWIRNPVDSFVLARLEKAGLKPNPEADRRTLLRRLSYDLTGLSPTPEEFDAFINDNSADAYEKQVDRLLASSRYGERWGRHWLDVIRYAETNGYERDGPKPNVWRFRDYVIRSFNNDKPFNQFVREQIAGDEFAPNDPDAIIATAFYRLGVWDDEPADPLQARFDEFDDIVATTSQSLLGMTMNCARCHDHKIDPIPQTDYYRLLAFFRDIPRYSNDRNVMSATSQRDITPVEKRKVYEAELKDRQDAISKLKAETVAVENTIIKRMTAEDQRASEGHWFSRNSRNSRNPKKAKPFENSLNRFGNWNESPLHPKCLVWRSINASHARNPPTSWCAAIPIHPVQWLSPVFRRLSVARRRTSRWQIPRQPLLGDAVSWRNGWFLPKTRSQPGYGSTVSGSTILVGESWPPAMTLANTARHPPTQNCSTG